MAAPRRISALSNRLLVHVAARDRQIAAFLADDRSSSFDRPLGEISPVFDGDCLGFHVTFHFIC